jgi:hypothetical protein
MFATVTCGPRSRAWCAEFRAADEQRPHQRVRRHRALDLRAPHVEPQLEEGPTVAIGSGVQAGEQVVVKGGILLND